MTLKDFKEWLKTKVTASNFYIGKIDGSKDQCIGIYGAKGSQPNIAIGGLSNTSYATKPISILVHWGKNTDLAEQKAQEIYNALFGQQAKIAGKRVIMFQMQSPEPMNVGTDDNNIYEYVIELNIIYER